MKLRKLHIEDYKMFKDFDMSFVDEDDNPLDVIVLAGVNGSGKTTLLEYINDFSSMLDKERKHNNSLEVLYRNQKFIINAQNRIEKEKNELNGVKAESQSFYKNTLVATSIPSSLVAIYYLSAYIKYFPSGIDDTKKVEDEFVKYWYNQVKFHNKRNDEITESLQKFITESFKGLDLFFTYSHIDEDDNIFFKNDNSEKFKINELSTGEKTLLSKVLYLFLKDYKDKVILIDEPELSLHPSWQNKVLKIYENFAKQNNCQIIIATHSPHIIASAKNEYLRVLKKNENGEIEVIENLKAEGRDINSILFDVMGEVAYRPKEFDDKIDRLHIAIDDRKIEEANKRLEELKKSYGENDEVVMEAQMLIDMFSRDTE